MTNIKNQKTVVRGQGLNDPYGISLRYPLPNLPRYDLMELRNYDLPDRLGGWCTAGKIKMTSIKNSCFRQEFHAEYQLYPRHGQDGRGC